VIPPSRGTGVREADVRWSHASGGAPSCRLDEPLDGEGFDVAAGDSAWFDASLPHAYGNPGRATATFTLAVLEPA
jgi:hypothetical protein